MFWDVYMGEHAAGGGFSFLIGFVAAFMLFAALAWHGLRTEPDAPKILTRSGSSTRWR